MAKLTSTYPGTLVLPDATEIAPGATVEVPADALENAGVKEWLDNRWLVKPGSVAKPVADDSAATKKALESAEGTVKALTAELDAERAKSADLEAKVAELNAALEEATKPKA